MKSKGFTLIELLVVVSIISLISAIGSVIFGGTQAKGRDAVRKQDLNQIVFALEGYLQKNGSYIKGTWDCTNDTLLLYDVVNGIAPFMADGVVPTDPKTHENYCYQSDSKGASYRLFAKLENCQDPDIISGSTCGNFNYTKYSPDLIAALVGAVPPPPPPSIIPPPVITPPVGPPAGPPPPPSITPAITSASINTSPVITDGSTQYTISMTATDSNGGADIGSEYAVINHQGASAGQYRGYVGWSTQSFPWWNSKTTPINCTGGGQAAINNESGGVYGSAYINLVSCATTISGTSRTSTFVVSFNSNFTTPINNTISGWANSSTNLSSGWISSGTFSLNVVYVDGDHDGFGAGTGLASCPGGSTCVANNTDCYDSNANAKPGQTTFFTTNRGDGSFDYDCNGTTAKDPGSDCVTTFQAPGCYPGQISGHFGYSTTPPACGDSASFRACLYYLNSCVNITGIRFCSDTCVAGGSTVDQQSSNVYEQDRIMPCK